MDQFRFLCVGCGKCYRSRTTSDCRHTCELVETSGACLFSVYFVYQCSQYLLFRITPVPSDPVYNVLMTCISLTEPIFYMKNEPFIIMTRQKKRDIQRLKKKSSVHHVKLNHTIVPDYNGIC